MVPPVSSISHQTYVSFFATCPNPLSYFVASHLIAKNMDGQNFREFIEQYSEYVLKNQNISDGEKEPIMTQDESEEKWSTSGT